MHTKDAVSKEDLRKLKQAIKSLVPVPDRQVKWLRIHRPSVAFLLCLGSGPWKFNRRQTVQARALEVLGTRDLSELTDKEVRSLYPLDWQYKYLKAAHDFMKSMGGLQCGSGFDDMFNLSIYRTPKHRKELVSLVTEIHYRAHGYYFLGSRGGSGFKKPIPKVLGMFVRDFLFQDIVPVDRHVKKWLKVNKLPAHPDKILTLFQEAGLHARFYARAMFLDISSNPMHKPTRKESSTKSKSKP